MPARLSDFIQTIQNIDCQLHRCFKSDAQRIGKVLVNFERIASQPIKGSARRREMLIGRAEHEGVNGGVPAAPAKKTACDTQSAAKGGGSQRRLSTRA